MTRMVTAIESFLSISILSPVSSMGKCIAVYLTASALLHNNRTLHMPYVDCIQIEEEGKCTNYAIQDLRRIRRGDKGVSLVRI